ncbi:MAG: DUF2071 domain-containing protein [Planctomycetota bacterium]
MRWADLAFLHWEAPAEPLRALLPQGLELDTHGGKAWLGVVPFEMQRTRLAGLPAVPGTARFAELNLRTYVRDGTDAGVWFFSLDAASRLAVRGARATFALPYLDARMSIEREASGEWIGYRSERRPRFGAPPARFSARYRPTGEPRTSEPGTLEHFLTERYCLFAERGFGVERSLRGGLVRGDIWHPPWPLQPAECELEVCDMFRLAGVEPPEGPPIAHFARAIDVDAYVPVRVPGLRRA